MHTIHTICLLVTIYTCKVLWEEYEKTKRKGINPYLKIWKHAGRCVINTNQTTLE